MKKYFLLFGLLIEIGSLSAMIRAGVNVGPNPSPYETEDSYGWYGPGYYYGVYYSDYPSYYGWRRRYDYGGPYYYRHRYHRGYAHGHHHR